CLRSASFTCGASAERIASAHAGVVGVNPRYVAGIFVTAGTRDALWFTVSWKFLRSDAENCPNLASLFPVADIAVKYDSQPGIGFPDASTKSPLATPETQRAGIACVS